MHAEFDKGLDFNSCFEDIGSIEGEDAIYTREPVPNLLYCMFTLYDHYKCKNFYKLILEASGVSLQFESPVNITSTFEIFQSIFKQLLNTKALCEAIGLSGRQVIRY
jgi:hypothetical protein